MALIKCPECGKDVSSAAETCIYCGYPIQQYITEIASEKSDADIAFQAEIDWLVKKVKPITYRCPEPRAKVCAKCGLCVHSEYSASGVRSDYPICLCNEEGKEYPLIEVDYPAAGIGSNNGVYIYIYENCVDPQNIGDRDSEDYNGERNALYSSIPGFAAAGRYIKPVPPNPKWFGVYPTRDTERTAQEELMAMQCSPAAAPAPDAEKPKCPFCGSNNLVKISATKSFLKIATFGLAGAGDVGKAWKCANCGSKF